MPVLRSTDHVARATRRALSQFQGSPKVLGILAAKVRKSQELENDIWKITDAISIDSPYDFILDIIGKIVGRGRNELSNQLYRLAIRAQIRINRSSGIVEDFNAVGQLAANDPTVVIICSPIGTAAGQVEMYGLPPGGGAVMWDSFRQMPVLGVSLNFVYGEWPASQDWIGSLDPTGDYGTPDMVNGDGWSGDDTFGGYASAEFTE
jgi:hypothetical protein